MVLLPSGIGSVLLKVAGRDEAMLTGHHATQAGKETLGSVRVRAVRSVGERVIDAASVEELGLKFVPVVHLIGINL